MHDETFCQYIAKNNGSISPLIIPDSFFPGTGLMNPSILAHEDKLLVNIRHCQYVIYHAKEGAFEHSHGPLEYFNPDDDDSLTTKNYLCELDENLHIKTANIIDTSLLDVKPKWNFIGLEDGRLVHWNDKLYGVGVRRDTTPNGEGRMELSEIENSKEISRVRIPTPGNVESYCEKNWMPVIDKPYHFVKWCNPTEVVRYDISTNQTETIFKEAETPPRNIDFRGGSQVIPIRNYYVACVHHTHLYSSEAGKKNVRYRHSFIVWNKDWTVRGFTKLFSFMGFDIEFCCGMTLHDNHIYMTFGVQDNMAFCLKMPFSKFEEYIHDNTSFD